MSRAMNLKLTEAAVTAKCLELGVIISAIEPLPGTGTHLVCRTIEGADEIRQRLAKFVMTEKIKRFPFYRVPSSW
mgnify:CR=1 FL=1